MKALFLVAILAAVLVASGYSKPQGRILAERQQASASLAEAIASSSRLRSREDGMRHVASAMEPSSYLLRRAAAKHAPLEDPPPPMFCSPNIFAENGMIDIGKMLYNCSENIASALFPPSYFPKSPGDMSPNPTVVEVQIALNGLLAVDDLHSTFVLDFEWRLLWEDPRINMNFWPYIHPSLAMEGIEIAAYINNENPVNFWRPDVYIAETNAMELLGEIVKILPDGLMFWSRHVVGQFAQTTGTAFSSFPLDRQNFSLTLLSTAYDTNFIDVTFIHGASVDLSQLSSSEMWSFHRYDSYEETIDSPSPVNPARKFSACHVSFSYDRQSSGIVYRLALPVMIFLVVVGSSFWAAEDQRIDITLQVLLLVSALYIIIGQSIPFVGYLTRMDTFIITVFVLLALTVSVHFIIFTFHRKSVKYPMDAFYAELLVYFFRIMWVPMSVLLFTCFFPTDRVILVSITVVVGSVFIIYFQRKVEPLKELLQASIIKLRMKEDLVNLKGVDEVTGHPIFLESSEQIVLKLTETWYQDPIFKELMFSHDLSQLDDLLVGEREPLNANQIDTEFTPKRARTTSSGSDEYHFFSAKQSSIRSAGMSESPTSGPYGGDRGAQRSSVAMMRQVSVLVRSLQRDRSGSLSLDESNGREREGNTSSSSLFGNRRAPESRGARTRVEPPYESVPTEHYASANISAYFRTARNANGLTAANAMPASNEDVTSGTRNRSNSMRSSLVDFKKTTLSRMGIILPRQNTLRAVANREKRPSAQRGVVALNVESADDTGSARDDR